MTSLSLIIQDDLIARSLAFFFPRFSFPSIHDPFHPVPRTFFKPSSTHAHSWRSQPTAPHPLCTRTHEQSNKLTLSPLPSLLQQSLQQPRLPNQPIKQSLLPHQLPRGIELGHLPGVQHDDAVGIENGVYAMGDGDDGTVFEDGAAERGLEEGVGFDVDGGLWGEMALR